MADLQDWAVSRSFELMTSYDSAARRAAIAYMRKVQFGWCEIGEYRDKISA
jgi:hypothetical protein